MLCFWLSETSTIQIDQSRAIAEVNATGVVYTYILTGVGIQTLFVHWLGCGRPQIAGRAGEDTPLFCMPLLVTKNPLTHGYLSE